MSTETVSNIFSIDMNTKNSYFCQHYDADASEPQATGIALVHWMTCETWYAKHTLPTCSDLSQYVPTMHRSAKCSVQWSGSSRPPWHEPCVVYSLQWYNLRFKNPVSIRESICGKRLLASIYWRICDEIHINHVTT